MSIFLEGQKNDSAPHGLRLDCMKKIWRMNRSAKGLLIVTTTFFSLVNRRPNSLNYLEGNFWHRDSILGIYSNI